MEILLVCGVGASSGFIAKAMRKAAKAKGLDATIIARSESELLSSVKDADCLLIGPHLAYQREAIEKSIAPYHVPFAFINEEVYGTIDGERALLQALDLIKEKGESL
ncbi:MAG: PTS sugar transporter subunit IIB [Longicatena sp.]